MKGISRRRFIELTARLGMAVPLAGLMSGCRSGAGKARVVVIGGGFGGATCARYIRQLDPAIDVTLVERRRRLITCPFSNLVLGGLRNMDDISHGYERLSSQYGIKVIHQEAVDIDPVARRVRLQEGAVLDYDRLVVSPGIDFRWGMIEGYDEAASRIMPHAWEAGEQTTLLRRQLEAMPDGGLVLMSVPEDPFRCPPGPYERASLIAYYLKRHKPRSRIIILDAKERFAKQDLFMEGWKRLYGDMISWVPLTQDGKVVRVNPRDMTIATEFERYRADVINIIPPQFAGAIARRAGLTDKQGWCPVDYGTFESRLHPHIHVIGDACVGDPIPKSGFAANSQGKVCAFAIVALLNDEPVLDPVLANTCYSLLDPDYGISVAGVYRKAGENLVGVEGAGGLSPLSAPASFRAQEAAYTYEWYTSIIKDVLG
ncbi:MAG: hypothetical protein A2V90_08095 [Gammaproteobacteria bacterium RBG_16_57_12]|nr:MAG: hypothetical protein A2V90_08095 [Gammaproteobacteria bacterium RBG_16_57_12]